MFKFTLSPSSDGLFFINLVSNYGVIIGWFFNSLSFGFFSNKKLSY